MQNEFSKYYANDSYLKMTKPIKNSEQKNALISSHVKIIPTIQDSSTFWR